jgi:uncharacterized tellurite resistance protein B-like protein
MSILSWIGLNCNSSAKSTSETDTVRKITQALDQLDPERARFIAAFAYLLSRVARADFHVSPEETQMMEKIVMERGNLPEEQAIIVIQMAKTQNLLFGSTENFLVTQEFKKLSNHEEKMALLDCLFAIAAAHEMIAAIEDNEISQIADELRIEHHDFIAVRSKYRNYLAVLKK